MIFKKKKKKNVQWYLKKNNVRVEFYPITQIIECNSVKHEKMKTLRQVNIKYSPNYSFNSMTNIKYLDTNLLAVDQITFTSTDSVVCDTEYFKNLDGVNSLYLVFNDVDAYFE